MMRDDVAVFDGGREHEELAEKTARERDAGQAQHKTVEQASSGLVFMTIETGVILALPGIQPPASTRKRIWYTE
jgi:hypothetical protein